MAQEPHEPSDKIRNLVKLCTIAGSTQAQIAAALGISIVTLKKYYAVELKTAKTEFIAQAVGVIAHHLKNKNLTAAIFTLKTQAQWKETGEIVREEEDIRRAIKATKRVPKRKRNKADSD